MGVLVSFGIFLVTAVGTGAAFAGPTLARIWRRQRIGGQPFPAKWRDILRRNVPLARELPAAQQLRLKKHIQVLLSEVPFIGCAGLEISDEMRVTIAAQAAFLLLGRGGSFGNLREVLVYPGHFVVPRSESGVGGVVHEGRDVLAGQSWQRGQVILVGVLADQQFTRYRKRSFAQASRLRSDLLIAGRAAAARAPEPSESAPRQGA